MSGGVMFEIIRITARGCLVFALASLAACGSGGGNGGGGVSSSVNESSVSSSSAETSSSEASSSSSSSSQGASLSSSSVSSSSVVSSSSQTSSQSSEASSSSESSSVIVVSSASSEVSSSEVSSSSSVSSASSSQSSSSGPVTLSGKVTYDFVPATVSGLDYSSTVAKPVRGAEVNLLNSENATLDSTVTDDSGHYSFTVTSNTQVKVQVEARSRKTGTPGWDLRVEDNTSNNALYVLEGSLTRVGSDDSRRDLHAPSGWDGSSYQDTRAAAPFAIMDTAYTVLQSLLTIDPAIELPVSHFRWSPLNNTARGELSVGDIGTSFYSNSTMYILGDEGNDTDEYDRHVIAHEWVHYLEDELAHRQDTIGGSHSGQDKLDMRVAFSEGLANGLAGYFMNDALYLDTRGFEQSSAGGFDISSSPSSELRGWFNESSVGAIIYNFSNASNGFDAVYKVLTHSSYRNASAHMSIFTFADRLQNLVPAQFSAFSTYYSNEDINSVDPYGGMETNDGATSDVLPLYGDLPTDGTVVNICSLQANGTFNKLGVWKFLRLNPPSTGNYTIEATKTSPAARETDPDFWVTYQGGLISVGESATEDTESKTMTLSGGQLYLLSLYDYAEHSTSEASCFDVSLSPAL